MSTQSHTQNKSDSNEAQSQHKHRRYHRRSDDPVHHHQIWWTLVVAFALVGSAVMSLKTPKNILIEQDRATASLKADSQLNQVGIHPNSHNHE